MAVHCFSCGKAAAEISECVTYAAAEGITPDQFVRDHDGTYNPDTDRFCCTECYIKVGMPSSPEGWKAP